MPTKNSEKASLIAEKLSRAPDLKIVEIKSADNSTVICIWLSSMTDKKVIYDNVIEDIILKGINGISAGEIKEEEDIDKITGMLLNGSVAILSRNHRFALMIDARGIKTRSITEPSGEITVKGPHEGFTEDLDINISLIRKRVNIPKLIVDISSIGEYTKTKVAVFYIDGLADSGMLKGLHERLESITLKSVLDSNYVAECIEDAPYSIFPTVSFTERPDVIASALLEGRIAVMVDGSAAAIRLPTVFMEFFQSPEDYYERSFIAIFTRFLREVALFASILLPGLYTAVVSFHPEMIPLNLWTSVSAAEEGIPFPVLAETLLMELSFEFIREAGFRIPRPLGQTMSIVGALILGQAAVTAGLVSAPVIVIIAGTGIAAFTIPHPEITEPMILVRIMLIIIGGYLGLFGIAMVVIAMHIHLLSLCSFGVPYFYSIAPLNLHALMDSLIRLPFANKRGGIKFVHKK